jgi:hypothetical protein
MCQRVNLTKVNLPEEPFSDFLGELRKSHGNGGANLVAFDVAQDDVFDWFASRNRLSDEGIVDSLLVHPVIRGSLADLGIPEFKVDSGLVPVDAFILDGRFASCLHQGGAYWTTTGTGKKAKALAMNVCDSMFGMRYGEISLLESSKAWAPWFKGIAWDMTEVIFDRRLRRLWIFALTDTD